jgi:hypothetical protein
MKKSFLMALALCLHSNAWLQAQPTAPLSGTYRHLSLGADPAQGLFTGYYSQIDDPPNLPSSECVFYFSGKLQGDKYAIQAWQPGDRKSDVTPGQLSVFSTDKSQPSLLLKLERLSRDCTALNPKLGQAEGALLDKTKNGGWTEVRVVGNSKSRYYQTPSLSSPERGSARRGTVLLVTGRQPGWAQVEADRKPKGWIQESDFYPLNPGETMPEPVKVSPPLAAPAPAKALPPVAMSAPAKIPPPAAVPTPKTEAPSKTDLLRHLKTLDTQAFSMALRVLANPAERNSLASSRLALEQELNTLVNELNKIDASAYRSESPKIYEAYLDLQYVRQDQPIVSLRLRQEMLK